METTGCAKPLPKGHSSFSHTTFHFETAFPIFSNKISIFEKWFHRLRFAFCLNLQPPDMCRCCISEVALRPGSFNLEISIFLPALYL